MENRDQPETDSSLRAFGDAMSCSLIVMCLLAAPPTPPPWSLSLPAPDGLQTASDEQRGDSDDHVRVDVTLAVAAARGVTRPTRGVDLREVTARWRQRAEDAGWHVVVEDEATWTWSATFEREGVRALATLTAWVAADGEPVRVSGFVEMGRVRPAFVASGPCLPMPMGGWQWYVHSSGQDQRGETTSRSVRHSRHTSAVIDVDGDLVLDWLVPVDADKARCPEDVAWEVWLVRQVDGHACGHRVGAIGSGWLATGAWRAPSHAGLRDLTTEVRKTEMGERHILELVTTSSSFRFDGRRYRAATSKTDSGVCHHCSTWTCSPAQRID